MYLVMSDKCRAHNLLKPEVLSLGPRWRIQWYVGVYQSRDKTESLCRPDLYSSTRWIIPYINGLESSSLYTCNTSWCSVHYIILNKPLVRLTTVHYQYAVSMISFAQVLTVQWSDTIPCWNVQFQVRIIFHFNRFSLGNGNCCWCGGVCVIKSEGKRHSVMDLLQGIQIVRELELKSVGDLGPKLLWEAMGEGLALFCSGDTIFSRSEKWS